MFIKRYFSGECKENMMKELLIAVNQYDKIKGFSTKLDCHKISRENPTGICHRAFSLFLFDQFTGDILLQKRAALKFTFPELWSNTVCSHPILNKHMNELQGIDGIFNAVRRRFNIEMGNVMPDYVFNSLKYIGRVMYKARSSTQYYENEIDYIVFGLIDRKTYPLKCNPEEIQQLKYCTIDNLYKLICERPEEFTPWLRKIVSGDYLQKWLTLYQSKEPTNTDIIIHLK